MTDHDTEKTAGLRSTCHLQWPTSSDLLLPASLYLLNGSGAFKIGVPTEDQSFKT